jgi:DNA-binding NarL/FixJ family response regulator
MRAVVTVVIADDHEIVRDGVRLLLAARPELRVVAEAADGAEAIRAVERHRPDILILDLAMPILGGVEVARIVKRTHPKTKMIVLSAHRGESYVGDALRSGAAAYVLKEAPAKELLEAIRRVTAGERYLSPPLSQAEIDAYVADPYETLTARERETLQLVAEGLTNQNIAGQLEISPRTVETHRANLMKKLALRTHSDLVRFAVRRGLIKP